MDISNMNNIESRVQSYWTKRAHNFNIVRKNELNSSISERWREEIVHFLPEGKVLQILDVGTGTGYFAIPAFSERTSGDRDRPHRCHAEGSL